MFIRANGYTYLSLCSPAIILVLQLVGPLGFEDPDYPDKVCKVVKALYGLHQAPRAWYEKLANYLLENGFQRGKIDQTLFIKKKKGDILLVQVYVDDIIFDGKSASTPIDIKKPLLKDPDGEDADVHIYIYRSRIGSLMYLTSSRPDIMFAVYACSRFQVTPKVSHLHAVKRIFSNVVNEKIKMGVRVGRSGRGKRPREGNDESVDDLNGQGNDQGMGANAGIKGVNRNVEGANGGAPDFSTIIAQQLQNLLPAMLAQENVRNVLVNDNQVGCLYKEFLACKPKEYDGKGGDVVITRWIKKIENVQDMSGCSIDQKICGMVAAMKPKTMQKVVQIFGALTDKAVKNGSIKKVEKKGNVGEASKDKNGRDDNKRSRTGNVFATTVNLVERENASAWPKCTACNSCHAPRGPYHTCFNCNRPGHLAKDCRGVPRKINPVNARNPPGRACYECGSTNHVRLACPRLNRAQGPGGNYTNQVVSNNEGIEPSELGFRFEIEIASGQLVEVDKVIKGCRLEIESHVFDIDLIPFEHGRATPVAKSPYYVAPSELEELSGKLKEL
nr:retrovirus-related Pol polyprotein from transposon TNT 1-94 [Tanacetum cinerariifolium]